MSNVFPARKTQETYANNTLNVNLLKARSSLRSSFVVCLVFGLVLNLLQLGLPIFSMQIFDRVLPSGQIPTLAALVVILLFITVGSTVIDGCRASVLTRSGQQVSWAFEQSATQATVKDPQFEYLLNDLDSIRVFISGPILISLLDIPWSVIYLAFLYLIHPLLGIYAFASMICLTGVATVGNYAMQAKKRELHHVETKASEALHFASQDRPALAAMGILPGLMERLVHARGRMLSTHDLVASRQGWVDASARSLRSLLQIGVLALGAVLTVYHETNAGAIVAGAMLFTRAIAPVERIASSLVPLQLVLRAWTRVVSFSVRSQPEGRKLSVPKIDGKVAAECVFFVPPGLTRPILENITMEIKPGTLSVIVGDEGAGKTTLAKLLCGAIIPTRGSVLLDGMAFRNYDERELGRQIGYLPETPPFRPGTISQLICREGSIDDAAVIEASCLAGLDQLIRGLPSAYQTELKLDPPTFSAGQLKRLALARALYGRPRLLVLDEPLSNLDDEGEARVFSAIQQFKASGSSIVVVSRAAKLANIADMMYHIHNGRLASVSSGETMRRMTLLHTVSP